MAFLLLILVLTLGSKPESYAQTVYHGAPQVINSTSLGTGPINDYTKHTYSFPAGAIGSFKDCKITRFFAAPIQSITLTIDSGQADDIGYVGNKPVTDSSGQCGHLGNVKKSIDITS